MAAKARVGMIGVGAMGSRMAQRLLDAGHRVTLYDADPKQTKRFEKSDRDAHVAKTLAEVGKNSDVLITMLPTSFVVNKVFREIENGALMKSLAKGSVVVDMTSSDPAHTRKLSADLGARGVGMIDAPVSGGITGAEDGSLVLMIGATDAAAFAKAKPVLDVLAHKLFPMGGSGNGHAMKALNNYVSGTGFMLSLEALMIGRKFGLDPSAMVDVLNVSTGRNFASQVTLKQEVISRQFGTLFTLGLLAKDVRIAADLAEDIGINAPFTRLGRDMYARALDRIGGDADHTEAVKYFEMLNNMVLTEAPKRGKQRAAAALKKPASKKAGK